MVSISVVVIVICVMWGYGEDVSSGVLCSVMGLNIDR